MNQKFPSFLFLFFYLTITSFLNAQTENDSLAKYSYEELHALIDSTKYDKQNLSKIYTEEYLRRAKFDNDQIKISRGYFYLMYSNYQDNVPIGLKYADSIIQVCKKCKHEKYPALGYYFKGYFLSLDSQTQKQSLDNFLNTLNILKENKNFSLELDTRNAIMTFKSQWTSNEEILKSNEDTINFILKNKDSIDEYESTYLVALFNLSSEYIYNEKLIKAKDSIKKGLKLSKEYNISRYYEYVHLDAIANYYLKDYENAIDSLKKTILFLNDDYDKAVNFFYLGLSNIQLGRKPLGVRFLLKLDSMYNVNNNVYPKLRSSYELIIEYYKEQNDKEKQIYYLNKLIEVDKKNFNDFKLVNYVVNKKYETPQAIAERARLIEELKNKESTWKYSFGSIAAVLAVVLGILFTVYRRQKQYKRRFDKLMENATKQKGIEQSRNALDVTKEKNALIDTETLKEKKDIGISEIIVNNILKGLANFENSEKYRKQVTLTSLAKDLGTNPKYLSKVINWHYQKNFSSYISELRVNYAVKRLKEDTTFRNYTIKAIAHEAGFGNAESFSKVFYKVTGIYPSYFIKQLQKRLES